MLTVGKSKLTARKNVYRKDVLISWKKVKNVCVLKKLKPIVKIQRWYVTKKGFVTKN